MTALDILNTLQNGFGGSDFALLANRVALGTFFTLSGYHKLFNPARHKSLVSTLEASKVPLVNVNQWFVPGVEFLGGLSLISGILSPFAALGLITICLVACATDGMKRIAAWSPIDRGDYLDDVLYLPEVLYCVGLALVVTFGAGPYTLVAHPTFVVVAVVYTMVLFALVNQRKVA